MNKDYTDGSKDDILVQSSYIKLNLSELINQQSYSIPLSK